MWNQSAFWGKHCIVLWDVLVLPLVMRARPNNQVKVISSCFVSASEWRKRMLRWTGGTQQGRAAVTWMSRVNWRREEPWWEMLLDNVTLISRWMKESWETAEACLLPENGMCRPNLLWPQFSVVFRVCYSVIFRFPIFLLISLHFNFHTPWNLTWLPHSALQRSKRVRRKRKKRKRKPRKRSLKARRDRRQRRRDKSRMKWKRKQKKTKRRHRKHSPERQKAAKVRQRGSHACSP